MSPIDRVDQIAASQKRLDNYLADLAKAVGTSMGEAGTTERAKLEGRLGPLDQVIASLTGVPQAGLGTGAVAATLGNTDTSIGQGNALGEPMFDTVKTTTVGTSEAAVSLDWWAKYVHASGTALGHTVDYIPWADTSNNSTASSMCSYKAAPTASGNDTCSIYTKGAITLAAGSPAMPYIVAGIRIVHLPGSVLTNLTTATATLELVRNLGGSETIEGSAVVNLLGLALGANAHLTAFVASPTILRLTGDSGGWSAAIGRTYDLRVKINAVASGANATGLRIALAEPVIAFAYSQDPIPFLPDRAGSRFWFGDGSDGSVAITSGTTTLTRDMLYENLSISAGATLRVAGYKALCRNRMVNRGTVHNDGGDSPGSGTGGAGGPAGSLGGGSDGLPAWLMGGSMGTAMAGGNGGDGTKIGMSGSYAASNGTYREPRTAMSGTTPTGTRILGGGGGGSAAGGAGGGGGGVVVIAARYFDNAGGTIRANGGGPGGTDGGGGGGGVVFIVHDLLVKGTEQALGHAGNGAGTAGGNGTVLYIRG